MEWCEKVFNKNKTNSFFVLLIAVVLSVFLMGCTQQSNLASSSTPSASTSTYTMEEVSMHNSVSDCWVVMNGNIYNITQRLANSTNQFDSQLANYCGKEMNFQDQNRPINGDFNAQNRQRPDFNRQAPSNMPQGDFNSQRIPRDTNRTASRGNGFEQYLIGKLV